MRAVQAVQHVRRMRGGAQSHLMRCSDGDYYVVKFQNNPQHTRVLANEHLATRLAIAIGLPAPETAVVTVDQWLIDNTSELRVESRRGWTPCASGAQFGSKYLTDPLSGQIFDYLPEEMLDRVRNLNAFAGALALDKWTCNANGRQAAFWKKAKERKYTAAFIDQGYCFNAGAWKFEDAPLRGVYARNAVYKDVTGWSSFEPWLSAIEKMDAQTIWECAADIPTKWYGRSEELETLIEELFARRARVSRLIDEFRRCDREPFPQWKERAQ